MSITQENRIIDIPDLNQFKIGDEVIVSCDDWNNVPATVIGVELSRRAWGFPFEQWITLLHDGDQITDGFKRRDLHLSTLKPEGEPVRDTRLLRAATIKECIGHLQGILEDRQRSKKKAGNDYIGACCSGLHSLLSKPEGEQISVDTPTLTDRLRDNAVSAGVDAITAAMCVEAADHIDALEMDLGNRAFSTKPPFEFDRYINGVLMAEGVTIEQQSSLADAMRVAARIASKGPNGEAPVLVYRPPTSEQISEHGEAE